MALYVKMGKKETVNYSLYYSYSFSSHYQRVNLIVNNLPGSVLYILGFTVNTFRGACMEFVRQQLF